MANNKGYRVSGQHKKPERVTENDLAKIREAYIKRFGPINPFNQNRHNRKRSGGSVQPNTTVGTE
jgi:hypothetical protein